MDEKSDLVKVEKYDKNLISEILENMPIFTVIYENEDIIYTKIDSEKEVNITINTINFYNPHIMYLKEDRIEFVGLEYDCILYNHMKSFVIQTKIDSKSFLYASSLKNESLFDMEELSIVRPYVLSYLIRIIMIIIVVLGILYYIFFIL